ncbi:MAG: LLM class F420-dependent oxidoreductase, partial [Acidimicrobiales bacterium]
SRNWQPHLGCALVDVDFGAIGPVPSCVKASSKREVVAMRFGVAFPNTEMGAGPDEPRSFVRAIEDAGFDYLTSTDHVLGAESSTRSGWKGAYDIDNPFHEIFVLFGFFAGFSRLELMPCVLVLPQRQTALVAKQAAEIDVLTGGNIRLGIGSGWNSVEYEGLGIDFHTRGDRMDEQIEVLRLLWTNKAVSFDGRYHTIDRAGLLPLPTQRPIPLWMGGALLNPGVELKVHNSNRVLQRIARFGDGWISGPNDPIDFVEASFRQILEAAEQFGRDPGTIGLQSTARIRRQGDRKIPLQWYNPLDDRSEKGRAVAGRANRTNPSGW